MKNILLIGGSYGIGLAIAKELQYENKFEYVLLNEDLDEALVVAENLITDFLTK